MVDFSFDENKWERINVYPKRTLQIFITSKCNKRCSGCFYQDYLGNNFMMKDEYQNIIKKFRMYFDKVILMGGEPTLHPYLRDFVEFNTINNLDTTIYTNGFNLKNLKDLSNCSIRIGVLGYDIGEKQLIEIEKTDIPVSIVLMLRRNNIDQLEKVSKYAEEFNCKSFFISSIRDIHTTKNYWMDTDETIPNHEYVSIVNNFVNSYNGNIEKIEIASRGLIPCDSFNTCRFFNIHLDKTSTICPFDISLDKKDPFADFVNQRKCNKNNSCILQKVVLKRK